MSRVVYLHIGPRKTGTTYLQHTLVRNQSRLAALGITYPMGSVTGPRQLNHETALLDASEGRINEHTRELRKSLRRLSGDLVLSGEALASCRPEAIARLMEFLEIEDPRVIITARAWDKVLPSLWQQHVRNGRVSTYATFLKEATREDRLADGSEFGRPYAYATLARRWLLHTARVSFVTVPRDASSTPEILWGRFLRALGVDPVASQWEASAVPRHDGLTACESLLLREINSQLEAAGRSVEARREWAMKLTERVFVTRPDRGAALRLPPDVWPTVVQQAEDVITDLTAVLEDDRVWFVGDLDDLRPPSREPEQPSEAALSKQLADLAGLCIAHLHASRR